MTMLLQYPLHFGQNFRAAKYKQNTGSNAHTLWYDPMSSTTGRYNQGDLPADGETPPPIHWTLGGGKAHVDAICTGLGLNKE